MSRALRIVFTVVLLTILWSFRRTRGAFVVTFLAGFWLRRTWVTGPARRGQLGPAGQPPNWVRAATDQVGASRALTSRASQSGAARWW